MYVIHGEENLNAIDDRYTTLELDTLLLTDDKWVTNYAIIGPDEIDVNLMFQLAALIRVHEALIENYKLQKWDFCISAITKLIGEIDPFMDTFYEIMLSRILKFKESGDVPPEGSVFPMIDVR